MSRNFILIVVVGVIVGQMSVSLSGPGGVARGQTVTGVPVVEDNFNDNKKGTMWNLFGNTDKATATEISRRLEFTAAADTSVQFVGYIGNKWWIDPNQDFQMKLDLHFDINSYISSGWVSFGITPNSGTPASRYATFGIGSAMGYVHYWQESRNSDLTSADFTGRGIDDVTLYIAYDALSDTLYLADTGYTAKEAWQTVSGLRSRWGRVPLYVFIATTTDRMAITSGHAYVDNFVIEKGKIGSPYATDPNDPSDGGGIADVIATLAIAPSTILRKGANEKVTAVVTLPAEIRLSDWNSADVPTLSPGSIAADAQAAFVWVDGSVKVLASFSKASLMKAIPTNGDAEVHVSGKLKGGRLYAASTKVTIE